MINSHKALLFAGMVALLFLGLFLFLPEQEPIGKARMAEVTCVRNLKQIGVSMRDWAIATTNQFPFQVSTNEGGSKEFCARSHEGWDSNSFAHLKVLSSNLGSTRVMICPQDKTKKPAQDYSVLTQTNVSYRIFTKPDVRLDDPTQILAICPVDGNTLFTDGRVEEGKSKPSR